MQRFKSLKKLGKWLSYALAPVDWCFEPLKKTKQIAVLTASITHNHPEGIKEAQATAVAIF